MAKGINHFGAEQQKMFLNAKLREALKAHKVAKDGVPFEYRHYGFLYPRVKTFYENMGFTLTWHKENEKEMYWSFTIPEKEQVDSNKLE